MNDLLQRQLRKHLEGRLRDDPQMQAFLDAVSETYDELQESERFLSHTLEVASQELTEANERLRREAESQFRRVSTVLEQTLSLQPSIIFRCRKNGAGFQVLLARGGLLARLGLTPAQVEQKDVNTLVPDVARYGEFERAWQGMDRRFEMTLLGSRLVCQVALHPVKEAGEISELIGVISDISAQKAAEDKLRQTTDDLSLRAQELEQNRRVMLSMIEDLDQSRSSLEHERDRANALAEEADAANRAKSEFLATISHELRTPLTSIRGFLQTLLADPDMPVTARQEFMAVVHDQSLRLSRLVDDLLDLSSLESGRTQFNDEPMDLKQIAETCLIELTPLADRKSQQIEVCLADALPPFKGDAIRLQSVFTNLLNNAIKFTPEGGHIRLELDRSEAGIRFAVTDSGPGIPADQREKIFEKFHRVYRRGRTVTGTGLGLPIVKAIVDHYHGRIELESQEGHGSCFLVQLPLATDGKLNGSRVE